jgi:hypothetical protein
MTKLSGAMSELPDAEGLATGSSTQCAATVLPERIARPSLKRSNLTECTSSGKQFSLDIPTGCAGKLRWQNHWDVR